MRVPNSENAIVDIGKLRNYCLNPTHEVGKHKARVFKAAFNLTENDAAVLQYALLDAIKLFETKVGRLDKFGQRYIVDFEFEWKGKRGMIRSAWIIDSDKEVPRLITCIPL